MLKSVRATFPTLTCCTSFSFSQLERRTVRLYPSLSLRQCKMITTAQARTAYQRQNTDTSETFSTARNALQPGTEVEIEEEAPVTAQSRVVEWTALGVLSSSWIEYARRTSSPGDPRLWQVEWFTWSLLLIITHLVHLIRSYGNEDLARQISFFDSSKFTLGHLNVLLVAVMNCVAHLLDLHYDLRCVLVSTSHTRRDCPLTMHRFLANN